MQQIPIATAHADKGREIVITTVTAFQDWYAIGIGGGELIIVKQVSKTCEFASKNEYALIINIH